MLERGVIGIPARSIREFSPEQTHANGKVGIGEITVGGRPHRILKTLDFPPTDGWSLIKGRTIEFRVQREDFSGRDAREDGVGDARNLLRARAHEEARRNPDMRIVGVDVDAWRAAVAQSNLDEAGTPEGQLTILVGGAVNDLLANRPGEMPPSYVFACLPQAPMGETHNHADGIDPTQDNLTGADGMKYGGLSFDEYGLRLNVAYLRALRRAASVRDTDVQLTISGRVPTEVVAGMFDQTGWSLREIHRTREPIQQDRDTGVAYVQEYSDRLDPNLGEGLFERTRTGLYAPVGVEEAEQRRKGAEAAGGPLNLYHHVSEYIAVPREEGNNYTGEVVLYEHAA